MQHDLVEQAQRGDPEAFQALVDGASDRLYAIAWRILRDADRAEDALQQALIQIWEDLPALREPERFDAWTYRLVVHTSYREARRERRWTSRIRVIPVDPVDPVDLPDDDPVGAVIDRDEVERGFRRLTPEHRAVLVLHYFVGLPVSEISEILGIPIGTARSRLHYAVRCLRAALEADDRMVAAWRTTA
jgi:RNA polymerase sigma-70 factor (ECF subfamily)